MYAYSGWEKLGYIAEEVIDPVRTLPRALLVGVALVIGIYLASNAAYLHVLGAGGLAASDTPALAVATATWGERGRRLVGVMVIASMFATLNLTLMTTPRVYYAMARDGLFFRSLGRISPRFRAPTVAILLQGTVGGLLAAAGTYGRLVDYKVLGDWVFLSLCGVALLRLRRKLPNAARPIPVPLYPFTPLALSVAGCLIVANALVTNPWHTAQAFAVIALGIPAFFFWWRAPTDGLRTRRGRRSRMIRRGRRAGSIRRRPSSLLNQLIDRRAQGLFTQGLLEALVGDRVEKLAGARSKGAAGDEDQPRGLGGIDAGELGVDFHSRRLRHHQIAKNDVEPFPAPQADSRARGPCRWSNTSTS